MLSGVCQGDKIHLSLDTRGLGFREGLDSSGADGLRPRLDAGKGKRCVLHTCKRGAISQPPAALMSRTPPAAPSVLLPAASLAAGRCTLLPLPPHEGSPGPTRLSPHRAFLACPAHGPALLHGANH